MLLLNSVLVHVGIVRIHPADVVESGGEERGVLVAVPGVSVGGLNRGALVDCEVGDHAEIMKEKCEREEVRVQKMDESGRAGRRPQRASWITECRLTLRHASTVSTSSTLTVRAIKFSSASLTVASLLLITVSPLLTPVSTLLLVIAALLLLIAPLLPAISALLSTVALLLATVATLALLLVASLLALLLLLSTTHCTPISPITKETNGEEL